MSQANSDTPTRKPRIVSIQVCRGLAAIVVVLAHLNNVERKYFPTRWMSPFQYGALGVDLFFVISGVVISSVTAGQFGSRFGLANARHALRFLYHRFARVYPVYWIYTAVIFAVFLYDPLLINSSAGHHVEVLRSFLLIPSGLPMLLMQGWTLSYEIYFYLVFFLLLLIAPERWVPWALAVWAAAIALHAALASPSIYPLTNLLTSPTILEFLAGCLIFRLYRRSRLHPAAGIAMIAASLLYLAGIAAWTTRFHAADEVWFEYNPILRPLTYGLFAAFFLFGLMELERTDLVRFARPFALIGDWSYSIYLSHILIIELFARTLLRVAPHLPHAILLVDTLSLPVVLLAGYLSFRFLERPLITLLYKPAPKPVPLR